MTSESLLDPVNQELLKLDGKVFRGKNGRLFLANDMNERFLIRVPYDAGVGVMPLEAWAEKSRSKGYIREVLSL